MGSYLYCEYLCKKPLKYQRLFTFSHQKKYFVPIRIWFCSRWYGSTLRSNQRNSNIRQPVFINAITEGISDFPVMIFYHCCY